MSKQYSQVMPLETDRTIKDQFGWVPESVYTPGKGQDWKDKIGDDGDIDTRRSEDAKYLPGLRYSEFNPELAEIIIRYWSMPGDLIVDPFAGRATRGIVGLSLGRKYQGYEIASMTYQKTLAKIQPLGGELFNSDGCELSQSNFADLIFTCPPYHQLEKYESAQGQLSDLKEYSEFLTRISRCAERCYSILDIGKFACWVVADWRDGKAFRIFHSDLIAIFKKANFTPWDIVVIKNHSPFTHLQAGKVAANRYTSKTHEYLMVFRKS